MANKRNNSTALVHTAENIGAALGHVAKRLDAWKKQRTEIAHEIQALTKAARAMLADLGHREAPVANKGGRPRGYVMSEETKAKLRAAWQRRHGGTAGGTKNSKSAVRATGAEAKGRISGNKRSKVARNANR